VSRLSAAPLAALLCLTTACLNVGEGIRDVLTFDFTVPGAIGDGWVGGVADVPAAQVDQVGLITEHRPLPPEISATEFALFLSGSTVNGEGFIFQKKYISGFRPVQTFAIRIQAQVLTNLHAGCTTGPGPLTVLKAGVSDVEPVAVADGQGILRLNLDKGAGTASGEFAQLGDIRSTLTGCPAQPSYGVKTTLIVSQSARVDTDGNGGFWLFFGTQSSFAGEHHIYIPSLRVTFIPE